MPNNYFYILSTVIKTHVCIKWGKIVQVLKNKSQYKLDELLEFIKDWYGGGKCTMIHYEVNLVDKAKK